MTCGWLRRSSVRPAVVGALLWIAACDGAPEGTGSAAFLTTRDSAGVTVVEAHWQSVPVIGQAADEPAFVIGEEASGVALHQVRDARRLSGTRIAVAHAGPGAPVLVAEIATGAVRHLGRIGDGPDELGAASAVFDTDLGRLGVFDAARDRWVVFDGAGDVVEATSLRRGGGTLGPDRAVPRGEGEFLASAFTGAFRSEPGVYRDRAPLYRIGPEGPKRNRPYSHSIVAGGFELTS